MVHAQKKKKLNGSTAIMKSDQNWFLYTAWEACKISLLVPSSFEQELHEETASLTPSGDRDLDFSPFPLPPTPSKKEKNTFSSLAPYINTELFTHSCFIFSIRTFSPVIPWINISSIRGVMLTFACSPTLVLRRTSSTRRAVLWIWVESRTLKN